MSPKTIKIIYWILITLFVLSSLADGGAGIAKEKTGREVMAHLGYPVYLMVITGIAKVLGALAILQNKFRTVKEWAFAGFVINAIGAFASRMFVGDGAGLLIPPLVFSLITFITYYFWKQYERLQNINA
ncbi:DoxX family protein [Mucilaginibacter terrenus]|uniref:DoxX family protein n=1 Tax=Mucilaginibacter terrenus TaxID=2482727 RepID=A0A3E2NPJ8_9SPHI|nr:DoxX family protein [Mucilaginibacter terrenus]RFZ82907.1 DoxX family protein [Mucilaginibacter terrenus]